MTTSNRPPNGCPGCNPGEVMVYLHAHGIHVEELPEETAGLIDTITCDRCGKSWLLMPRPGAPNKPAS